MIDLILRNAALQDGSKHINIAVDEGVIIECGNSVEYPARQEIDLSERLAIPGFIDPHVHLDIALMNPWAQPGRQEEFHKLSDLNEAIESRRKSFSQQDIEQRAGAALELASRHGVTHLRAQCHLDTEIGLRHIEALQPTRGALLFRLSPSLSRVSGAILAPLISIGRLSVLVQMLWDVPVILIMMNRVMWILLSILTQLLTWR